MSKFNLLYQLSINSVLKEEIRRRDIQEKKKRRTVTNCNVQENERRKTITK